MSRTLLLADDSVTIQKIVGLTFANEGMRLVTVDNGDDALIRARAIRPDLVLADANMPGLTGYELCAALRDDSELKDIPVLLLTGAFERVDERLAEASGVSDFISKPFEAQALVNKVEALLQAAPAPPEAPEHTALEAAPQVEQPLADPAPAPPTGELDAAFNEETVLYREPIVALTPAATEDADQELEDPDQEREWMAGVDAAATGRPDPLAAAPGDDDDDPFRLEALPSDQGPLADSAAESRSHSGETEASTGWPDDSGMEAFGKLPLTNSGDSLSAWDRDDRQAQRETPESDPLDPFEMPPLSGSETSWDPEAAGELTVRVPGPESGVELAYGPTGPEAAALEETAVFPASDASASTEVIPPRFETPPTVSTVDRERITQEVSTSIEKLAWDAFGPLSEQIVSQVVQKIEEIAWEAVPQIAERLVRAEIERLKGEDDPEA